MQLGRLPCERNATTLFIHNIISVQCSPTVRKLHFLGRSHHLIISFPLDESSGPWQAGRPSTLQCKKPPIRHRRR